MKRQMRGEKLKEECWYLGGGMEDTLVIKKGTFLWLVASNCVVCLKMILLTVFVLS